MLLIRQIDRKVKFLMLQDKHTIIWFIWCTRYSIILSKSKLHTCFYMYLKTVNMLQYVASLYISGCMTGSGDVVHNNATWKENDCTTCTCVHGRAECKSMLCEARCSSPRKVPGQCCPVCDGRCSNLKQVLPHIKPLLPITLLSMGKASCSCTIYKAPTPP